MKDVLKSGKDRYWIRTPGQGDYRKLEITQRIHDGADCYPWRPVFALWPVKTIGGRYVWLRKIYKQKFWVVWGKGFHMEPHVEYAELFDILTYEH
jgi:hypothetical protein